MTFPDRGRLLGVDLGSARIGLATCDAGQRVATGLRVLFRSGDRRRDHEAIARVVADEEATGVVVGLPLSLNGTAGPAARDVAAEVDELRSCLPVPVETWDERFTTVSAHRALRTKRAARRRSIVDQVAAAVILQSWLDSRSRGEVELS